MANGKYYHDLATFLLTDLQVQDRQINALDRPSKSTRQAIVEAFKEAGWSENHEGVKPFRRSFTPINRSTRVHMVDGRA